MEAVNHVDTIKDELIAFTLLSSESDFARTGCVEVILSNMLFSMPVLIILGGYGTWALVVKFFIRYNMYNAVYVYR